MPFLQSKETRAEIHPVSDGLKSSGTYLGDPCCALLGLRWTKEDARGQEEKRFSASPDFILALSHLGLQPLISPLSSSFHKTPPPLPPACAPEFVSGSCSVRQITRAVRENEQCHPNSPVNIFSSFSMQAVKNMLLSCFCVSFQFGTGLVPSVVFSSSHFLGL